MEAGPDRRLEDSVVRSDLERPRDLLAHRFDVEKHPRRVDQRVVHGGEDGVQSPEPSVTADDLRRIHQDRDPAADRESLASLLIDQFVLFLTEGIAGVWIPLQRYQLRLAPCQLSVACSHRGSFTGPIPKSVYMITWGADRVLRSSFEFSHPEIAVVRR